MNTSIAVSPSIERQERYVAEQGVSGENTLIAEGAFVRGIRDLGYQNTPKAIDELIDNAIQARAEKIHVWFGMNKSTVTAYAIIDDGHGMIPEMLGYAAKWGGTDREGDRKGLGRYGYGLPSSCVSQGKRFQIYSRIEGKPLMRVLVDLEELRPGKGGRITAPIAEPAEFPPDLASYIEKKFGAFTHGTVVLVDKLDRLTWSTRAPLQKHLLEHIGLIYRNYLGDRNFVIDEKGVEPVDPLFLTVGARHYDLSNDFDRATPYEPMRVPVKTSSGETVIVNVRASYLPPRIGYIDKNVTTASGHNPRMNVMADHEGIIVMRMGRQMDVVTRHPWGKDEGEGDGNEPVERSRFSNYRAPDRYWQIELDFPAELDEKFSVTTSKQSVRIGDSVWDALADAGVKRLIADIRKKYREDVALIKSAEKKNKEQKRPSEEAMEKSAEFKGSRPSTEQSAAAERNDERATAEAKERSALTGLPFEDVRAALQVELVKRPFVICEEANVGAPFYRPEGVGGQIRVWLNTTHPFFTDLYAGPQSSPEICAALEVMLFVVAGEEVNAFNQRLEFYERERSKWSDELRTSLRALARILPDSAADAVHT